MIFDKLKRRINNTSTERKPGMPHIHGIKGEAVPPFAGRLRPDNKGDIQ
jgi:hypothetical protein